MSDQSDWAKQVPADATRPQGPYGKQDYGWERGDSIMPEFRDPSVHEMPYEMPRSERLRQWMDSPQGMAIVGVVAVALIAAIVAGLVARQRMG